MGEIKWPGHHQSTTMMMVIPRLMRLDDGLTQLIFLDVNSEIGSIQNKMMNFNSILRILGSIFFQHVIESIPLSYISPCIMFSLHNSIFKKMSKPQIGLKKNSETKDT